MESRRREWNFYCLAKSGMATTGSTPLHIKNSFGGGVLNINYYFFFFFENETNGVSWRQRPIWCAHFDTAAKDVGQCTQHAPN